MMPTATALEDARPKKFMPFGPRAHEFAFRWPAEDATLNILSGSVRSAKTWSTLVKTLLLCRYEVAGRKIFTGYSKETIFRNVLTDLFEIIGEQAYQYNRQSGELNIFGSKWLVIGAHDEGSERVIRGMTVGVAMCDELVKMPQGFFKMLLSRMSPDGARLYATTNPDNPYHWVKTDVIDNADYVNGLGHDLWAETFTMQDNPSLTPKYKDFLRRSYTGVWYQRFVLGNWVQAQGAVYGDLVGEDILYNEETRPVRIFHRNGHGDRFLGLDMGTVNAFAVVELYDDGQTLWADRELYFDSKVTGFQKTNTQYADDLDAFLKDCDPSDRPSVIIDPSAASFKVELNNRGYLVIDAENEVLEGIRKVSTLLGNKRLRIHRRCVNLIRELQSYMWDDKRTDKGVEQPVKAHDHACFASGTLVQTPDGAVPIEQLMAGDAIVTPLGVCKVLATAQREAVTVAWNGTGVTPDHPVLTAHGLRSIDALRYDTYICEWNQSLSMVSCFGGIQTLKTCLIEDITRRTASISWQACGDSIKKYGNRFMARFQKAITSITRTATGVITTLLTWRCSPAQTICLCTGSSLNMSPLQESALKLPASMLLNGIDRQRGANGTRRWQSNPQSTEKLKISDVNIAGQHSSPKIAALLALYFVLTIASRLRGASRMWTMFPGFARYAAWSIASIATVKPSPVADLAGANTQQVYALRTEHGCYFANGVLVSNCDALRYACATKWSDYRIMSVAA